MVLVVAINMLVTEIGVAEVTMVVKQIRVVTELRMAAAMLPAILVAVMMAREVLAVDKDHAGNGGESETITKKAVIVMVPVEVEALMIFDRDYSAQAQTKLLHKADMI